MSIEAIKARRAAIDGAPWKYENRGQTVFGFSPGGCNKTPSEYMVANIRGWGHLQYMGVARGDAKAQAMQDANGEFIGHAPEDVSFLLAEIERLRSALRRHVICTHYKPNLTGEQVTARTCDECDTLWKPDGPEQHKPDCLAAIPPT